MSRRENSTGLLKTVFGGTEVIEPSQRAIIVAVLLGMLVGAAWNGLKADRGAAPQVVAALDGGAAMTE